MRLKRPLPLLSKREKQVCLLIAQGLQDKEIAAQLKKENGKPLSENTVRNYVSALFMKLAVDSREKVIIWAFKTEFIKIHSSKSVP